jgi:hypothetical protein
VGRPSSPRRQVLVLKRHCHSTSPPAPATVSLCGVNEAGRSILRHLNTVAQERERRARDPRLAAAVVKVKSFQHERFARTYADLLANRRYAVAARFFLDDLYGPHDFTDRDAQFARIVPGLVRLFPAEIVQTVACLAELHALSEVLDSEMGEALADLEVTATTYAQAWRSVGRREDRIRQILLMRSVGDALDRYTRMRGLRQSLRLMRLPARAAGLEALHMFLEQGFDTFRDMSGAAEFLQTVDRRETAIADALFEDGAAALDTARLALGTPVPGLGELP